MDLGYRTKEEKAEEFRRYLQLTFTPLELCDSDQDRNIKEFLDIPCQMCRLIKPFTYQELTKEIKQLNKITPGYDMIDYKVIKAFPKKGVVFLTLIFNSVIRLSHFPRQWKHGKITMIPKPENIVSSYRPISNRQAISLLQII